MSKYLVVLIFIAAVNLAYGKSSRRGSSVTKDTSIFSPNLGLNESVYHFRFNGILSEDESLKLIQFSIDGIEANQTINASDVLSIKTTPGKHIFQIVYGDVYEEVFTDSLEIEAQHTDVYSIELQYTQVEQMYFKPIIYLYPEIETAVEVIVDIKGRNPFYYPQYNEGWTCLAKPNGELTIDGETYNYLFWEATGIDQLNRSELNVGFYVAGENAIQFLEDKLNTAGFTGKEKADFITFWGPKIQQSEHNLVQFDFNENCDKYAELSISPKPDHIYRIYIKIAPLDMELNTNEQVIESINRSGFTVLEWGGQMSSKIFINNSKS